MLGSMQLASRRIGTLANVLSEGYRIDMAEDLAARLSKNVKQLRMPPDLKSIGGDSEGVTPGQLGQ